MKRLLLLLPLAATIVTVAACDNDDSPTDPSDETVTFLAQLSPASEIPAVTGAEATGGGTARIVFRLDRDSANTITDADADFQVTLAGFPPNTALTMAHIHDGNVKEVGDIVVNTNLRREVFLLFKESVNNIVKHSGAKHVAIDLKITGGNLTLTVADDGRGFTVPTNGSAAYADDYGGNGILSMKKRAAEMGGEGHIVAPLDGAISINADHDERRDPHRHGQEKHEQHRAVRKIQCEQNDNRHHAARCAKHRRKRGEPAVNDELANDPCAPGSDDRCQKKCEVLFLTVAIFDIASQEPQAEHVERNVAEIVWVMQKPIRKQLEQM